MDELTKRKVWDLRLLSCLIVSLLWLLVIKCNLESGRSFLRAFLSRYEVVPYLLVMNRNLQYSYRFFLHSYGYPDPGYLDRLKIQLAGMDIVDYLPK